MADHDITLYWRPACGFCSSLRRQLDGTDLVVREVNIWDEPAAAATVRAYANGNETVPTVVIGEPGSDTAVGLVNPTARQVLAALDAHRR
jgi:glutaredoxin